MIQEARKKHGMMMADSEPEADLPAGPVDPMSPTSPPLYPPAKRLRSFVWEFFGYPKQKMLTVLPFPNQSLSIFGASTRLLQAFYHINHVTINVL